MVQTPGKLAMGSIIVRFNSENAFTKPPFLLGCGNRPRRKRHWAMF
jgi:hypothetical protein